MVTGGAGFIGSHVVDRLVEQGYQVTIADNLSNGRQENINPRASFRHSDISNKSSVERLPDTNVVFHLAALARVQPSIKDPVKWHETNVNGTLNILEYARKNNAKVIYSSTSSIYGDTEVMPTPEDHPKNPLSPYALQKYIGEQYLNLYARLYDLDFTTLRYFNVYGERQIMGGAYSSVIGTFLDKRERGEALPIRNTGEQRRDYTYVGDVADANILAMDWKREPYNVGAGNNYSVNEIAEMIGGETEKSFEVIEPFATLADNSKAKSAGWQPKGDVKDWINANLD